MAVNTRSSTKSASLTYSCIYFEAFRLHLHKHPLLLLNPTCSSLNKRSNDTLILSRITLQNTFLAIGSRVILFQLSWNILSSFFGSLTTRPFDQSSGICSWHQFFRKRWYNKSTEVPRSTTGAFLFFRAFTAVNISLHVGSCVLILRSIPAGSGYIHSRGSGLFRTS